MDRPRPVDYCAEQCPFARSSPSFDEMEPGHPLCARQASMYLAEVALSIFQREGLGFSSSKVLKVITQHEIATNPQEYNSGRLAWANASYEFGDRADTCAAIQMSKDQSALQLEQDIDMAGYDEIRESVKRHAKEQGISPEMAFNMAYYEPS